MSVKVINHTSLADSNKWETCWSVERKAKWCLHLTEPWREIDYNWWICSIISPLSSNIISMSASAWQGSATVNNLYILWLFIVWISQIPLLLRDRWRQDPASKRICSPLWIWVLNGRHNLRRTITKVVVAVDVGSNNFQAVAPPGRHSLSTSNHLNISK